MASFFCRLAQHKNVVAPALATVALVSLVGTETKDRAKQERQASKGHQPSLFSSSNFSLFSPPRVHCEAALPKTSNFVQVKLSEISDTKVTLPVDLDFTKPPPEPKAGFKPYAQGYFYDIIPNAQLFTPRVDYPMWDKNWDGREPKRTGDDKIDRRRARYLRKHGVTRHIILVRHGQYDERHRVRIV